MDNPKIPQEVVNEIKRTLSLLAIPHSYAIFYESGAQIAQSHYLKELQAKDTTIKELQEKNDKLTGLLKEHYETLCKTILTITKPNLGEEEINSVCERQIEDFCKQHGI